MGLLTLAEMETDLRFAIDNRSDLTAAQLDRWLNLAYKEITDPRRHRHHELQTAVDIVTNPVAQAYDIEVASAGPPVLNLRSVYAVVYYQAAIAAGATRNRLRQVDIRQIEENATTVATGIPTKYAIWNNTPAASARRIVLDLVPSAITHHILIYGYREAGELAAALAASVLTDVWDEAIMLGARWRAWRDLNQPDRAELSKNDYLGFIAELERENRTELEDRPGLITSELEALAVEVPSQ